VIRVCFDVESRAENGFKLVSGNGRVWALREVSMSVINDQ